MIKDIMPVKKEGAFLAKVSLSSVQVTLKLKRTRIVSGQRKAKKTIPCLSVSFRNVQKRIYSILTNIADINSNSDILSSLAFESIPPQLSSRDPYSRITEQLFCPCVSVSTSLRTFIHVISFMKDSASIMYFQN